MCFEIESDDERVGIRQTFDRSYDAPVPESSCRPAGWNDIGTGDGIPVPSGPDYAATRSQMRTAPLSALPTRNRLMHDGLTFTKREAIERHGMGAGRRRDREFQRVDAGRAGAAARVSRFALTCPRFKWQELLMARLHMFV